MNEAGLAAHREGVDTINMHHFDQARTVLAIGRRRSNIVDPVLSKRMATHEIGHALVGVKLGLTLYKVALADVGAKSGYTEWLPKDHERYLKSELLDQICMLLASRASEELSGIPSLGCFDDIKQAKEIAAKMSVEGMLGTMSGIGAELDIENVLVEQKNRAKKILETHAKERSLSIEALAQYGELSCDDFHHILSGNQLEKRSEKQATSGCFGLFNSMPASHFARLPKQKKSIAQQNIPKNEAQVGINIEDAAKILQVDSNNIRRVESDGRGGIEIKFKPSFSKHDHMERIERELESKDVECSYLRHTSSGVCIFHIRSDGLADFRKLFGLDDLNVPNLRS